jgi:hypothetical protein
MEEVNIYGVTFPVRQYVDTYFGGFIDPIFYDLLVLFSILAFIFFAFKIVTMPFRGRR